MFALCLGLDDEGHAVTWQSPVLFNEDGALQLLLGPGVMCNVTHMRVIGRGKDGFLDIDVGLRIPNE